MANKPKRSTIGIWLQSEKYKRFALACKRFNFQISEILEDMMAEFVARYPPEDPNQIQYIQAPVFTITPKNSPNVREEYKKGLLKWMNIFICPRCGDFRHLTSESYEFLEKQGIRPSCHKCGKAMNWDGGKKVEI